MTLMSFESLYGKQNIMSRQNLLPTSDLCLSVLRPLTSDLCPFVLRRTKSHHRKDHHEIPPIFNQTIHLLTFPVPLNFALRTPEGLFNWDHFLFLDELPCIHIVFTGLRVKHRPRFWFPANLFEFIL